MGLTDFPRGDALAVQRFSTSLAVEAEVLQYFRKFMGSGDNSIIMVLRDLEKKAGEKITYALRMKLSGYGAEGDNIIKGTSFEEGLVYQGSSITIDQLRKTTLSKGKMSEQRVPYDIRAHGRDAEAVWFAENFDQQFFMYLSGLRGTDASFYFPLDWTGRANNTLGGGIGTAGTSPGIDSDHHIWAGSASSTTDCATTDTMNLDCIERCVAKVETLDPMIQSQKYQGENKFVLLMHTYHAYSLRKASSENDWVDIHKSTDGKDSPIYKNALGEYADVILHKHRNIIRFAGTSVTIGRALFLGSQAGVIAFGGSGQYGRYSWNEEFDDRGNALAITAGSIFGINRNEFGSKAFGVLAVDTACADPNA